MQIPASSTRAFILMSLLAGTVLWFAASCSRELELPAEGVIAVVYGTTITKSDTPEHPIIVDHFGRKISFFNKLSAIESLHEAIKEHVMQHHIALHNIEATDQEVAEWCRENVQTSEFIQDLYASMYQDMRVKLECLLDYYDGKLTEPHLTLAQRLGGDDIPLEKMKITWSMLLSDYPDRESVKDDLKRWHDSDPQEPVIYLYEKSARYIIPLRKVFQLMCEMEDLRFAPKRTTTEDARHYHCYARFCLQALDNGDILIVDEQWLDRYKAHLRKLLVE